MSDELDAKTFLRFATEATAEARDDDAYLYAILASTHAALALVDAVETLSLCVTEANERSAGA